MAHTHTQRSSLTLLYQGQGYGACTTAEPPEHTQLPACDKLLLPSRFPLLFLPPAVIQGSQVSQWC